MNEVEYEIVDNSPTRISDDAIAPSSNTITKMERSLEQLRMLRKAVTAAQRISDPAGAKAKRKTKNRAKSALAKASRTRNR